HDTGLQEGIGVDGRRNPSRKPEGCDEEESGEQASEERSTKGDDGEEILNPSAPALSPGPAPVLPASPPNRAGLGCTQQSQTSADPTPPCHDQHHFLRSSVRPPSKRIRKDSIGSTINGHGGAKSKGAVGQSGPVAGSTGGVSKASKAKEGGAGWQPEEGQAAGESWSTEDKNSFFEGLYEHGKDFEAIQNNIAMKYKKRGKPANMVKNKEQVRHFYYRTWHKISKHIDFATAYSRVLKKSSQELYGLICYAELRKKVGGLMDDKNVAKLNELIQQGATTVRSKGRNLRIKAPMCRALKKLCDPDGVSDEEDQKPVRLPLKVAVELQPRSNQSWARVQTLAHNPRLRMVVELHRKVSSLIEYLKQKWTYHDQRILKSLMEREALEGGQSGTASPGKSQQEELFLYPAESSTLTTLPGVARVVHSKASCTVHWLESGKTRPNAKELPAAQILGIHTAQPLRTGAKSGRGSGVAAGSGDGRRTEPLNPEPSQDCSPKVEEKTMTASSQQTVAQREEGMWEGGNSTGVEACSGLAGTKSMDKLCSGTESSLGQCEEEPMTCTSSPEANQTPPGKNPCSEEGMLQGSKERAVEQIRGEGWSARDTENVTLAELYLMFGKPGKLQLEYEWQPIGAPFSNQENGQASGQLKPNRTQGPALPAQTGSRALPHISSEEPSGGAEPGPTPPGKGPLAGVRSPSFGRQQPSLRGARLHLPNAGVSAGSEAESGMFAVPTTLPPNSSRHNRMFSPNKEAELALKQQLDSISMQSDLFLSRQRKPRNRQLRKPLVVQRTLLPRTTGDTPQHVCSFSILSNSSATGTGSFRPIHTRLAPSSRPLQSKASPSASSSAASQLSSAIDLAAKSAGIIPGSPCREPDSLTAHTALLNSTSSVDAEPGPQLLQHNVPENGHLSPSPRARGCGLSPRSPQREEAGLSPAKLSNNDSSKLLSSSPSVSPSRGWIPSPSHDPQWYPSDSSDSTLGCLLCDVDYIARFNDLAQELAVDGAPPLRSRPTLRRPGSNEPRPSGGHESA
ncbi:hypothetical protein F7725_003681, partial [Dissostichus mawsoni]